MTRSQTVAIIPARGGSKRIPRKNIKLFAGRPMISWALACAIKSELFDKVVVSTDDSEIAEIAERLGAWVPFVRPTELANDLAGTDIVLKHAITWLASNHRSYSYACCIYPTAPFLEAAFLKAGFDRLITKGSTSVIPVTTYPYPIFRALTCDQDTRINLVWPEHRETRSQDLPETFHDAGQFYWLNIEKYRKEWKIFNNDSCCLVLPRSVVQDIDTMEDWVMAERMFSAHKDNLNYRTISPEPQLS